MNINLPDENGSTIPYQLTGTAQPEQPLTNKPVRTIYAAAHVVANPFSSADPSGAAVLDWEQTLAFRRHLADLGLGIAEAMDTAQRGMGLDWPTALELIRETRKELPDALVANGCGTDQLHPADARSLDDVRRAYMDQLEAIQSIGGRVILMASRALAKVARGPDDYRSVYADVLTACDQPVILHWLGDMFDPQLSGYWGSNQFEQALDTCLQVIDTAPNKVDGIKISLLDKDKEIQARRRLPENVRMYTGDDFNYPELIAGDEQGYSHALLGIFDPLAPVAARAINQLGRGNTDGFSKLLEPTVPLSRHIFKPPTQHYKTGVVFLAWLNGFQSHFVMVNGAQSMRSLMYFVEIFRLADQSNLLRHPELAVQRMGQLLNLYGIDH